MRSPWPRISGLPLSAKALVIAFVGFMILNHFFAGWLAWEISHSAAGSAREHFQYKNLVYLLRMSHQHAFGHGTMYFLTGGLFLSTAWPEKLKLSIIGAAFMGALLDLASWWLMKYSAYDFEWLSLTAGALFSAGFMTMALKILYETVFVPRID